MREVDKMQRLLCAVAIVACFGCRQAACPPCAIESPIFMPAPYSIMGDAEIVSPKPVYEVHEAMPTAARQEEAVSYTGTVAVSEFTNEIKGVNPNKLADAMTAALA